MDGRPFHSAAGVDVDSEGVVWQNWRGTDQVTAFDRRKCKVLSGPTATVSIAPKAGLSIASKDRIGKARRSTRTPLSE